MAAGSRQNPPPAAFQIFPGSDPGVKSGN